MRARLRASSFVILLVVGLAAQDELPVGKGRETVEHTCAECHGLDKIQSKLRPAPEWRAILRKMRAGGATMTDAEFDVALDYLVQWYGTDDVTTPAAVNVNKAAATEIEAVLQISPRAANAIVRYRQKNGPYKEWRDLTKVEGVDKSTVEARKDRMLF